VGYDIDQGVQGGMFYRICYVDSKVSRKIADPLDVPAITVPSQIRLSS
jgi:hypothetical protein